MLTAGLEGTPSLLWRPLGQVSKFHVQTNAGMAAGATQAHHTTCVHTSVLIGAHRLAPRTERSSAQSCQTVDH